MRNIEEFIDQQVLKDSKEIGFINSLILETLKENEEFAKEPNRGNAAEYSMFIVLLERFQEYCRTRNIKLSTVSLDPVEKEGSKETHRPPISIEDAKKKAEEKINFYIGNIKKWHELYSDEEFKDPWQDTVRQSPDWSYDPDAPKLPKEDFKKKDKEKKHHPEKEQEHTYNKIFEESRIAVYKLFNSIFFQNEYLLKDKDDITVKEIIVRTTGIELSGKSTADLEIIIIYDFKGAELEDEKNLERRFRISLKRGNAQAYASSRYISRQQYEKQSGFELPLANGSISKINSKRKKILQSLGGGPNKLFYIFGYKDLKMEKDLDALQNTLDSIYKEYTEPPFKGIPGKEVNDKYKSLLKERNLLISAGFDGFQKHLERKLSDPKKNKTAILNVINIFYNLLTRSDEDVQAYIDIKEGPSILFTPLMEKYAQHILKLNIEKGGTVFPYVEFIIPDEGIKEFSGGKTKQATLDKYINERLFKIIKNSQDLLDKYSLEDEDKYNRLVDLFKKSGLKAVTEKKFKSTEASLEALFQDIKSSANLIINKLNSKNIFRIEFEGGIGINFSKFIEKNIEKFSAAEQFYLEFIKYKGKQYPEKILNFFKTSDYEKAKRPETKQKILNAISEKLNNINSFDSFKKYYFAREKEQRLEDEWSRLSPEDQASENLESFKKRKLSDSEVLFGNKDEGTTKFLVNDDFKTFIAILNEIYEFEKTDPAIEIIFALISDILTPRIEKTTNESVDLILNTLILEKLNEKEYSKVMKKISSSGAKGLISAVPSNKTANTIAVRFDEDASIDAGIKKVKSSLRSSGYDLEDNRVLKFDQKRDTTDVIKNGEVVARLFFRADIKERKGLAYEHIIGAVLTKKITPQLKNRIDLPPDASKEQVMEKLRSEEFGKLFKSAKKAAPLIIQKVGNIISAESVGSTNNKADFVLKTDQGKTIGLSAKYATGEKDNEYKMNKVLGFGTEEDSLVYNPKGIPWWIVGRKTFLKKLKGQTSSYSGREYNPDPEDLDAPAWMKTAKESNPEIYKETMEEVYGAIRNILASNLKKLGLKGLIAFANEADLGKEEERENYDMFLKVMDGPSGLSVTEISLDGVDTDGLNNSVNLDQIVVQDRSDIIIKIPGHDELKINSVKFKSDMLSSKAGDLKIKTR